MDRGVINLSYALLSFVLLREWRLESISLRSQHCCLLPVEKSTDNGENPPPPAFSWYCMSRIKAQCIFSTKIFFFSIVLLWCLFHNFFSSLYLPWCLMFYQKCMNWTPWLVDLDEAPKSWQTHVCSLGLASLDRRVRWPFCKLHPRCKRPSGVLICLGSDETHRVIFTTREFCVKEEILPSSATSYPLLSKNLWFFSDSGGKKV